MTRWYDPSYGWHDSFMCVTWLIHMCDMNYSYAWHDMSESWYCRTANVCETWRIYMCDMTHSYVRQDSFICETWPIHMWDMTHSYKWHDSFICETWLIHVTWLIPTCDTTHLYVWHDFSTYVWHDCSVVMALWHRFTWLAFSHYKRCVREIDVVSLSHYKTRVCVCAWHRGGTSVCVR